MSNKTYARLQDEPEKAYAGFLVWLRLGSDRTYPATAKTVHKSTATVKRWASMYDWKNRLQEWEYDLGQKRMRALERHQQTLAQLETQIINDTVLAAATIAQNFREQIESGTLHLGSEASREWVETAIKLSRMGQGQFPLQDSQQQRDANLKELLEKLRRNAEVEAEKRALTKPLSPSEPSSVN